jgi:hypothetical protein
MTLRILAIIFGSVLIGLFTWFYSTDIAFLVFWLVWISIVTFIVSVYYYTRYRKYFVELNHWKEDYLEQSYFLLFETSVPKGGDTAEKVINLSRLVFPELRPDYIHYSPYYTDHINNYFRKLLRREYRLERNYVTDSYSFDLVLKTLRGYYVVKDFSNEIVTVEHVRKMTRIVSRGFKDKFQRTFVFRAVCIAKEYESAFMNRQSLEMLMNEQVRTNIKIDLLIDEGKGFSVLWVS